jgi:hypothetical protein
MNESRVAILEDIRTNDSSAPDNDWIQASITAQSLRFVETSDVYVEIHDEEPAIYEEPMNHEWEDAAIWDFLSFEENT